MGEWREVLFSDLLEHIVDNRGKTCPTSENGTPLIATNCIKNDSLFPVFEKVRFVSKEIMETWFRGHPQPGDLIFVTKGSPGRVCYTPNPVNFCIAQDMVSLRANKQKVTPKYLFAVLRSQMIQERIDSLHVGTLIPHFKKGDFDKLKLPIPDLETQEHIGSIYYDFCNKIDLNRKMNETLEEMARAIFKSWFVDFDPVHAKARGEKPAGMPDEIADLFPSEFVHSDKLNKPIPKGWTVKPLDEIADFLNGLALQKFPPKSENDKLPVIKIAQLRKGDSNNSDFASKNIDEKYIVQDGDVIFSWSGSLLVKIWCGGEGALNQHLFKVTSEKYNKWFYFLWCSSHLTEFQHIASTKATTMGHIQRRHLSQAMCIIPNETALKYTENLLSDLIEKIICIETENNRLAELRDSLLPKLISGEIEV